MALGLFLACQSPESVQRRSNLMDYVYPNAAQAPRLNPQEAKLQLPVRVGLAFVPANWRGLCDEPPVPLEAERPLLEIVQKAFQGKWWVKELVVLPSTYLTPEGGFPNLQEVARVCFQIPAGRAGSVGQGRPGRRRSGSWLDPRGA